MELTDRDIARFLAKVDVRGADECWPWLASCNHAGYGKFGLGGRGKGWQPANRVAYRVFYNTWPEHYACHTCDNPPCCNPRHLYDGSPQQNQADAWARYRHRRLPGWQMGERNSRARLTAAQVMAIRAAPGGYGAIADLARRFGVATGTINQIRRGESWTHLLERGDAEPPPIDRAAQARRLAADNYQRKLTEDDVRAIRAASRRGERQVTIGQRFGVRQTTISAIVRGKAWWWVVD